ncbi:hypothetical protein BKA67DRAFT_285147 [Truncatella angustata]|uniref:Uncharacterized protein n=1 Tax=Truncatella angustata TaxID=152316 RepID=A0A9P8UMC2_9PEZI|nr:uncharacterized protein BKA67DRAFT_285147 [Truncatella angustata]KAH6654622.1 hypothetical protein BKA67DRAFT_285147 [Truncatella angustata]
MALSFWVFLCATGVIKNDFIKQTPPGHTRAPKLPCGLRYLVRTMMTRLEVHWNLLMTVFTMTLCACPSSVMFHGWPSQLIQIQPPTIA